MERLKGFLIILLCNFAGNILIMLSGLPVPGSVLGMLILLVLLLTKRVKLETVEPAASLLIAFMLLFILPDGVNLMNSFHKFEGIVISAGHRGTVHHVDHGLLVPGGPGPFKQI